MRIPNVGKMRNNESAHSLLVGLKNGTATLEQAGSFFHKVKQIPYDPVISLLGIYQRKMKTYVPKNTCMQMLTAFAYCPQTGNNPDIHQQLLIDK